MKYRVFAILAALFALVVPAGAQTNSGLWVGTVSLTDVTEFKAGKAGKAVLSPAGGNFQFQLLIWVDGGGVARVIKDALVLRRDHDNNPNTAIQTVIVTDPSKIPGYTGVLRRTDGKPAVQRFSASAYDFGGASLSTTGSLAVDRTLDFTIETAETSPTNPFRHKYHPDHEKGRAFTRAVTIGFKGARIDDTPTGAKRIVGTYKEIIKNLLARDIEVAGSITLDRVTDSILFNP